MAYAVRRITGAPTTAEQEEAFVYRIRRDEEEEATPLFGLNVSEDEVERVANTLDRVVMVHVPTQRVGNTIYTVPQLRLPERFIAPFTQPIAPPYKQMRLTLLQRMYCTQTAEYLLQKH